jgi:hypothetical protein
MTSRMKTMVAAVAVAGLVATPALAKSQDHQARISHTPLATNSTFVTIESHVIGVDPAPSVRLGILRDYQAADKD